MEQTITPEEVAKHYSAALDSVNLINGIIAGDQMSEESEADKKACVERNVAHLEIMVEKDFMQDQDLAPLNAAIAAGQAYA
jgi:hypothetical protein